MTVSIYLVDDNLTFLKAVSGFLGEIPDVRVIGQSTRGKEGLSRIAKVKPDLVLLDINLPDITGIEVAQAMSTWTQPPLVLFLSMYDSEAYLEIAQNLGAIGFVNKADFADELPLLLGIFTTLEPRGTCQ